MPRLIFRSNYFKNESASHRSNFMKYLATRENVEFVPEGMPMAFFDDLDMHGKKENYVGYIAQRPRVAMEEGERHGLFSSGNVPVDLERVMGEVANHKGTVWINVLSLPREDAMRFGYDDVRNWQNLFRKHEADLAEAFQISPGRLRWYAAFHNEGYHPHAHLVVYSQGSDGYLSRQGIGKLKSVFAHEIYGSELGELYRVKTDQRKSVKEQARENLLLAMKDLSGSLKKVQEKYDEKSAGEEGTVSNETGLRIREKMTVLAERLSGIRGRKVYGYLHPGVKRIVDDIVDELEKIPEVSVCYEKWKEYQDAIYGYYSDGRKSSLPLSKNPEFKSIKNAVIREAILQDLLEHPTAENVQRLRQEAGDGDSNAAKLCRSLEEMGSREGSERFAVSSVTRLLRQLEGLFDENAGGRWSPYRLTRERKYVQKEQEKRMALGAKGDDGSSEDNGIRMKL